jgi:hypothetical protein
VKKPVKQDPPIYHQAFFADAHDLSCPSVCLACGLVLRTDALFESKCSANPTDKTGPGLLTREQIVTRRDYVTVRLKKYHEYHVERFEFGTISS